jgi:hypothetical protein
VLFLSLAHAGTTSSSPLPLLAISQRSYSNRYNVRTPIYLFLSLTNNSQNSSGSRPTARKQSYTHKQDVRNQKVKEVRKEINEKSREGRQEITQIHAGYAHAPKAEKIKEVRQSLMRRENG